jgi:hypothetical protein
VLLCRDECACAVRHGHAEWSTLREPHVMRECGCLSMACEGVDSDVSNYRGDEGDGLDTGTGITGVSFDVPSLRNFPDGVSETPGHAYA